VRALKPELEAAGMSLFEFMRRLSLGLKVRELSYAGVQRVLLGTASARGFIAMRH
jgi:hypothetical protein